MNWYVLHCLTEGWPETFKHPRADGCVAVACELFANGRSVPLRVTHNGEEVFDYHTLFAAYRKRRNGNY